MANAKSKSKGTVRKKCFTPEQQVLFDRLLPKQRKYIEMRGMGFGKKESYLKAGYKDTQTSANSAYRMELEHPQWSELIEALHNAKLVTDVVKADSEIGKKIDKVAKTKAAVALQTANKEVVEKIDNMDATLAKQIKFFRDIVNGKIKSVRETTLMDADKKVQSIKREEYSDINTRMKAQKELAHLLGLNKMQEMGTISVGGNVNIMIVKAKKDDESASASAQKLYDTIASDPHIVDTEAEVLDADQPPKPPKKRSHHAKPKATALTHPDAKAAQA